MLSIYLSYIPQRFPEQLRLAGFDLHERSVRLVSLYHSRIRTPDVHSYPPTNNNFSESFYSPSRIHSHCTFLLVVPQTNSKSHPHIWLAYSQNLP